MRRALIAAATILVASFAYQLGAQDPPPDPKPLCLVDNNYHPGCAGCGDYDCPACDGGICPGNAKRCRSNSNPPTMGSEGWMTVSVVEQSCFDLYGCKPQTGEGHVCGEAVPCVTNYNSRTPSHTTFPAYDFHTRCKNGQAVPQ
jgi:hypothetical protein